MAESEKNQEQAQPPELDNHYPIETDEPEPSRNYLMLAALAVAALAFATLVVLGGRWAYDHWHKKPATSTTGSQQRPTFQNESTSKSGQNQTNKQANGSSGSKSTSNSSGATATATQLPNNGPGNVVALFLGSSALAALAHYKFANRHSENRQ